jgi:hypothetical protein
MSLSVPTVIEHLCADTLVVTERWIEPRIAARLDDQTNDRLDTRLFKRLLSATS